MINDEQVLNISEYKISITIESKEIMQVTKNELNGNNQADKLINN